MVDISKSVRDSILISHLLGVNVKWEPDWMTGFFSLTPLVSLQPEKHQLHLALASTTLSGWLSIQTHEHLKNEFFICDSLTDKHYQLYKTYRTRTHDKHHHHTRFAWERGTRNIIALSRSQGKCYISFTLSSCYLSIYNSPPPLPLLWTCERVCLAWPLRLPHSLSSASLPLLVSEWWEQHW